MEKRRARTSKDILWVFIMSIIAVLALGQMIALFVTGGRKSGNAQSAGITAEKTDNTAADADSNAAGGAQVDGAAVPQETEAVSEEALFEIETETEIETEWADQFADKPDIDTSEWMYILANPWNSIGEYAPELTQFRDVEIDYRIYDAMNAFVTDAEAQGLTVVMTSGYRGYDTQSWLFQRKVDQYGGDEETAATIVARPGTSEHQTGLAADITDNYYEYMNESLEETALYQWMSAHCHEYGFIVRFPKGRQDVTGIMFEPWHYRYVGKEAAAYIMEHDLTLEEFLSLYQDAG